MHKKRFIPIILSLIIAMPFINSLCASAADSENTGNTVPNAVAVIIFLAIFVAVSVVSAILTYKKIEKNKNHPDKEN